MAFKKWLYLALTISMAVACGSAKVEPLEEVDLDGDGGPAEPAMEEPAKLRSFNSEKTQTEPVIKRPEPACSLDTPLPSDVDANADASSLHETGQGYILKRDGASAVAVLLLAEKKAPKDPAVLGDLATALLQCRLYDEAIMRGEKAAKIAKTDVDIIANLAQIYQIVGRLDDAIEQYRAALEIEKNDHASLNNLAVLLVAKKSFKDAEVAARQAHHLAPENTSYLVNLGYVLYRQQRLVDAEMILKRALQMDPENANALNQMGVVLAAQRRNDRAKESFQKALKADPNHRSAKENLKALESNHSFLFDSLKKK